ncbi:hypothetical protein D3C74_472150 [compost metagenome]
MALHRIRESVVGKCLVGGNDRIAADAQQRAELACGRKLLAPLEGAFDHKMLHVILHLYIYRPTGNEPEILEHASIAPIAIMA